MSDGISRFEDFWRTMDITMGPPYVHAEDKEQLTERDREIMKLDLLPLPVNGNLRTADVVVLMLNPGFSEKDQSWGDSSSREGLMASERASLYQRDWPNEYPLFDLNPAFAGSGGAEYWAGPLGLMKGKFGHVAQALAAPEDRSHSRIRCEIANRIAIVQLLAYRSTSFKDLQVKQPKNAGPPQRRFKSSQEALKLADSLVKEGKKLVVVPYGIQHWGYKGPVTEEKLVVYRRGLREAHIAPTSAGYQVVRTTLSHRSSRAPHF